jgi:drug/metabolite transporter (DMT)-like permease
MNNLIIIITGALGATLTFYVSHHLKQGAVRASALLSLLVGLFFYCFPDVLNSYLTKNIPIVFIGTSFVGMISSEAKKNYGQLAIAGTLFSIIYSSKNNLFDGFGGALGAMAFIALLASLALSFIFSKMLRMIQIYLRFRRRMY